MLKHVFSFIGSIILGIIVPLLINQFFFSLEGAMPWIAAGVAVFAIAKFSMGYTFLQGHGVGITKTRKFLKLPIAVLILGLILIGISIALISISNSMSLVMPIASKNISLIGWGALSGIIISIFHWYFYAHDAYFYGSEYDARMQFKTQGDSPEEIERKIHLLKTTEITTTQ